MSKEQSFEFNPLYGSLFSATKGWAGTWSETGGDATHAAVLQQVDDVYCISFRKFGASKWTHCEVDFAAEGEALRDRAHKGHVTFKGSRLNIWLNYTKGHEGDSDHARYDLKPRSNNPAPF